MLMTKEEYISYKSNKVKTNNYRALKYGVVYADFILEDIANTILNEHKELDFVMVIKDETAYLYANKQNINVNAIAREYGGTDNYFTLREDREYFSHMKLFSIEFLGYDRNKYYREIVAKDKDEALYKFHRDNYGDVQRCEFVKYIY